MSERRVSTNKIGVAECGDASVDPQLWHACAGSQVQVPQVGSTVIYFPQGHGEHASSPPDFSRGFSSSTISCRVLSVKFLADAETDEVYAHISLLPETLNANRNSFLDPQSPPQPLNLSKIASFAKTLTQSDANNGGGFSVPRYCAETIFPRLDYNEDPPVQIVHAKDVHGNVWKFRHIYRGTPRRHLLTTGWSNFVNRKKLVAGDAIVFLRGANGELCVGVRRSTKSMGTCDASTPWHRLCGISAPSSAARPPNWETISAQGSYSFLDDDKGSSFPLRSKPDIAVPGNNFARNRARVTPKSVLEAATLAAAGMPFEVVFYPRATIAEFCVRAQSVRASLQQNWVPGVRFKMAVETEDASRISWFMGTVSKVEEADPTLWPGSPWKMLLVTWDEPDLLQGISRVSPWQVDLVSPMQLPLFSFPKKKLRLSHPADFLLVDGHNYPIAPFAAAAGEIPQLANPWHGYADSKPAGMQGARHDRNYGLSFQAPIFPSINFLLNGDYQHQETPMMGEVMPAAPTEPIIREVFLQGCGSLQHSPPTMLAIGNNAGNAFQSQHSSSIGSGNEGGGSRKKSRTFMLFGKTIDASQTLKLQQPQLSSDSSRHEAVSDGFRSEVCDDAHRFFPEQGAPSHPFKVASLLGEHQDLDASRPNHAATFQLPSSQQLGYSEGSASNNGFYHCKVFSEGDDVGRTVDLSKFFSYGQLYEALENMYGAQYSDFVNRVVWVDSMGYTRTIGDVPYWDFMQRTKKLKILTESSSENTTKEV